MITRSLTALIAALMISALTLPVSFAQPEDPSPGETPTEVPANTLNVVPAGIAVQDWEVGTAAIHAVPSPIGGALPGAVYVEVGVRGAEARLFLDDKFQSYTYDCPDGRCTGFATDLWRQLPVQDQRAYVDGLLDALMQSYPNLGIYRVFMDGIGWAAWDTAHGRSYHFSPPT